MGILIDKTVDCPYVSFSEDGLLEIEGRSITEDAYGFWQPLIDWLHEYVKAPAPHTKIVVSFEYTNSSSNKFLHEIFRLLDSIADKGNTVEIIWKYEQDDESIYELGTDLSSMVKIPFNFEELAYKQEVLEKIRIKSKKSGKEAVISLRYWDAIKRNGHGEEYTIIEEHIL